MEETLVTRDSPGDLRAGLVGTIVVDIERRTPGFPGYGSREQIVTRNLIVSAGMNFLTTFISSQAIGANSQMAYTVIGTSTTAASLNQTTILGEVKRLAFSATSVGASQNSWSSVTTFGGGTDGITNVVVAEAGVGNAAGSGAGVILNRAVLGSTFTLQNSDVAAVQIIVAVGSR